MSLEVQRPFLKWAGAKTKLVPSIRAQLGERQIRRWIEPFMGSCAAALSIPAKDYVLGDSNPDLGELYREVIKDPEAVITRVKALYAAGGTAEDFYVRRLAFNTKGELTPQERAATFIYLNRFCFNGLCRYNALGIFNTPYGKHTAPYLPEEEIRFFAQYMAKATFVTQDFGVTLQGAGTGDVVYCDPPYVPIAESAFTSYAKGTFSASEQARLAQEAEAARARGAMVILSNHDTVFTRKIYAAATTIQAIQVTRTIGRYQGRARTKANELLAVYQPEN